MTVYRHIRNKQLYLIRRSRHGSYEVEPYNRGWNDQDRELLIKKNGSRKKVYINHYKKELDE